MAELCRLDGKRVEGDQLFLIDPGLSKSLRSDSEDAVQVQSLIDIVEAVAAFGDYRRTHKKECLNLVRRMKLLIPLLEEARDLECPLPAEAVPCFCNLRKAFVSAKKLLRTCREGSKIYLALESDAILSVFHGVYEKLNLALDGMPYDELGISDEVKEQVELMQLQLRRSKKRRDTQDMELAMDIIILFSKKDDRNADSAILERLAHKLDLHTLPDLRSESVAVNKLVKERAGQSADTTEQILYLLSRFKQIAGMEDTNSPCTATTDQDEPPPKILEKCLSLTTPNDFLCPISLELMSDPVIVATGQTYDRSSIQKWFDSDHRTCPKTGQTLTHLSLAPNYALRNLISQWCEKHNVELPKRDEGATTENSTEQNREEICKLVQNLSSRELEVQRKTVRKVRMLSKESPDDRVMIASSGGIPPLVNLLSYPDSRIQEHTVTALLNLSIDEGNKRLIANAGAIPAIIDVLQHGSVPAKENSAAALFSLSMVDDNKVMIGSLNGIPALVLLLQKGTVRGKKDAATALFNLSLNQANKARAVNAGIVPPLLQFLTDKNLGMVDEALSILFLLTSIPEGRSAMGQQTLIETLVELMREGTPKNKECAIAVLLELGLNNSSHILAALQFGVYEPLAELAKSGTSRARRKANSLLHHMSKCEHIP